MATLEIAPATPWQAGSFNSGCSRVLFGSMFEDPSIEIQAFAPGSRVFCIASAGCTARALAAAGHRVTAVDINPLQLAYAQSRANGDPQREGFADRLMAHARSLLPLVGWTRRLRTAFLNLTDPAEQLDFGDRYLDSTLWRTVVDTLFFGTSAAGIRISLLAALKTESFGPILRARLRRGWSNHPNRWNPYAWRLLLGKSFEEEVGGHQIRFECADAAAYLESLPAQSFDSFSLSNICDGASPAYLQRLDAAVGRAAAPRAIFVTRSFAEPASETATNHAERDRSLLWGSVNITRKETMPCCIF